MSAIGVATAHPRSGIINRINDDRAVGYQTGGAFRARGDVQRMEPMNVTGGAAHLFGFHFDIKRAADRIDHRRGRNSHFGSNVRRAEVAIGHRCDARAGVQKTGLPQRRGVRALVTVRVKCIDAVMFGGHKHDVMRALTEDRHVGHDQRLSIDVPIHRVAEELAERVCIHIGRRKVRLVGIESLARVVVMVREHRYAG